jgi:hypothetical protein
MILTSYLCVGAHYEKNNGVLNNTASVSIVTLCIQVVMANCCWKQWTVVKHGPRCAIKWSFGCICWFSIRIYTKMLSPITKIHAFSLKSS